MDLHIRMYNQKIRGGNNNVKHNITLLKFIHNNDTNWNVCLNLYAWLLVCFEPPVVVPLSRHLLVETLITIILHSKSGSDEQHCPLFKLNSNNIIYIYVKYILQKQNTREENGSTFINIYGFPIIAKSRTWRPYICIIIIITIIVIIIIIIIMVNIKLGSAPNTKRFYI